MARPTREQWEKMTPAQQRAFNQKTFDAGPTPENTFGTAAPRTLEMSLPSPAVQSARTAPVSTPTPVVSSPTTAPLAPRRPAADSMRIRPRSSQTRPGIGGMVGSVTVSSGNQYIPGHPTYGRLGGTQPMRESDMWAQPGSRPGFSAEAKQSIKQIAAGQEAQAARTEYDRRFQMQQEATIAREGRAGATWQGRHDIVRGEKERDIEATNLRKDTLLAKTVTEKHTTALHELESIDPNTLSPVKRKQYNAYMDLAKRIKNGDPNVGTLAPYQKEIMRLFDDADTYTESKSRETARTEATQRKAEATAGETARLETAKAAEVDRKARMADAKKELDRTRAAVQEVVGHFESQDLKNEATTATDYSTNPIYVRRMQDYMAAQRAYAGLTAPQTPGQPAAGQPATAMPAPATTTPVAQPTAGTIAPTAGGATADGFTDLSGAPRYEDKVPAAAPATGMQTAPATAATPAATTTPLDLRTIRKNEKKAQEEWEATQPRGDGSNPRAAQIAAQRSGTWGGDEKKRAEYYALREQAIVLGGYSSGPVEDYVKHAESENKANEYGDFSEESKKKIRTAIEAAVAQRDSSAQSAQRTTNYTSLPDTELIRLGDSGDKDARAEARRRIQQTGGIVQ